MRSIRSEAQGEHVRLYFREWDGIDRPDYTTIHSMAIGEAIQLVESLKASIEQANRAGAARKLRRKAEIPAEIRRLQDELASL